MKRRLSFAVALALCLSLVVPAKAAPAFPDVPSSHWAKDAIAEMAEQGVVRGTDDGKFLPSREVGCSDFSTMLARMAFPEELASHTDTTAGWWQPYADTLLEAGALDGTTAKAFYIRLEYHWDKAVTEAPMRRYDMAQIMYNTLKVKGAALPGEVELAAARADIPDFASVPSDYADAVAAMYALGCLKGTGDGSFQGDWKVDRAQTCVVLQRLQDKLETRAPDPDPDPTAEATPEPDPTPTPEPTPEPTPAPSQNTPKQTTVSDSIGVGQKGRLSGLPAGAQASYENKSPDIVDVTQDGWITGKAPGKATVIVTVSRGGVVEEIVTLDLTIEGPAASHPSGPDEPAPVSITEESAYQAIMALKAQYPEGMRYTNDNSYYCAALRTMGYGCAGFAFICSDAAFGNLPGRQHRNFDQIRVGDILRVDNNSHSVVVLEKRANSVIVTEGNFNSSIHWGREITRQELEAGDFVVTTRYP